MALYNFASCQFSFSSCDLDCGEAAKQVKKFGLVYVGILAAVYTALYARFSSQWHYLADVYNQIKSVRANEPVNARQVEEWKAAFIEDADTLHLVNKPLFASIVSAMGQEPKVLLHLLEDGDDSKEKWLNDLLFGAGRAMLEDRKKREGDFWRLLSWEEERDLRVEVNKCIDAAKRMNSEQAIRSRRAQRCLAMLHGDLRVP